MSSTARVRPPRARLQSLCGTARGLAGKQGTGQQADARKPCRHAAVWACQSSVDCSRRMAASR